MVRMPLPRPPLHVDVTPSFWDVLAMALGRIAAIGTVTVLVAALLYAWQVCRRRKKPRVSGSAHGLR
jgi:hypothetical protein